jgi:hypothetical protein
MINVKLTDRQLKIFLLPILFMLLFINNVIFMFVERKTAVH